MRFQTQCIPGREEDGSDAWWYVYDTIDCRTVWPRSEREPSPIQQPATLIAEAYEEVWRATGKVPS